MRNPMPCCLCAVVMACAGCFDIPDYTGRFATAMAGATHGQVRTVHGSLTLRPPGTGVAALTVYPRFCRSGQAASFAGVDLVSEGADAVLLRVVEDPILGTRLRVQRAGGSPPWVLDSARCHTLAAVTDPTTMTINGIQVVEGSVAMDCTTEDGTVIAGEIRYDACHTSDAADAAALAVTDGSRVAALPTVPQSRAPSEAPPALPPALQSLRVLPSVRVVGSSIQGEPPQEAQAECMANTRSYLQRIGWVPVADTSAPHDLDVEMSCTGHVLFRTVGGQTEIDLPDAGAASVRIRADGQEIAAIPPAPRQWRCDDPGDLATREQHCGERLGRANDARLTRLIATSPALTAWAEHRGARR